MGKNKESKVKERKGKLADKETKSRDELKGILKCSPKIDYLDLSTEASMFSTNVKLRLNIYKGYPNYLLEIPIDLDGSDLSPDQTPIDNSEDLSELNPRYRYEACYSMEVTQKNPITQRYQRVNDCLVEGSQCDIESALPLIAQVYGKNIYRITVQFNIDTELLKILNQNFLHCTELFCNGFTTDAVKYMHLKKASIVKKITKLGFIGIYATPWSNCLTPFKNLQQLTLEQKSPNEIEHTQNLLIHLRHSRKIDTISLRFFHEPMFYWKFASCCKKLKFSDGYTFTAVDVEDEVRVHKLLKIMPIHNMSKIEINLQYFPHNMVMRFFSVLNIYNLETVHLSHVKLDSELLEHFCHLQEVTESKIKKLTICYFSVVVSCDLSLATLCTNSVEKLGIFYSEMGRDDFLKILKNCPNLEELEYEGAISDPPVQNLYTFDHHSTILFSFLEQAIVTLEKFKSFKTSLTLKPDILILLCNPVKILKQARFVVHGINPVATKEMLERFYDTVVVYGDFCRKEPKKEQNNNDFVDTCGFWKIFLDNPKASPPREKMDFSPIYCDIQKCLCKHHV